MKSVGQTLQQQCVSYVRDYDLPAQALRFLNQNTTGSGRYVSASEQLLLYPLAFLGKARLEIKKFNGISEFLATHRYPNGFNDYAVRRANSERASDVLPTQGKAIERARELNPRHSPDVERVRHTNRGKPDQWRKA
jgi:hypothetical protein